MLHLSEVARVVLQQRFERFPNLVEPRLVGLGKAKLPHALDQGSIPPVPRGVLRGAERVGMVIKDARRGAVDDVQALGLEVGDRADGQEETHGMSAGRSRQAGIATGGHGQARCRGREVEVHIHRPETRIGRSLRRCRMPVQVRCLRQHLQQLPQGDRLACGQLHLLGPHGP